MFQISQNLVEIDIDNGKIMKRFNAPGSVFLNDVVSDNQGNIYVSDTITNTIYKLDGNNNIIRLHYKLGYKAHN